MDRAGSPRDQMILREARRVLGVWHATCVGPDYAEVYFYTRFITYLIRVSVFYSVLELEQLFKNKSFMAIYGALGAMSCFPHIFNGNTIKSGIFFKTIKIHKKKSPNRFC